MNAVSARIAFEPTNAKTPTDDDLIKRIAGGDQGSFRKLMERYTRRMLSFAERTTGSTADADEILQEAFLKVWLTAPSWRVEGAAKFSTWLYRVVLNSCLDRRRRRVCLPLDDAEDLVDIGMSGYDEVIASERRYVILECMATLPDRQRSAMSLHYFSELSAPDAAHVLGITVSTMESLLVRGKRSLKKALIRNGITGIFDVV